MTSRPVEFVARFGRDDLLDIEHPASGIIFPFSVTTDARGNVDLVGPSIMGVADDWPDDELTRKAVAYARLVVFERSGKP